MENCPAVAFVQYFLKNLNPCIFLAIVLCFSCLIVICDFVQIKFVRHFESIRRNTWCKLKLLDIFCGITAGFAYRRTSDFAFKNARRGIRNRTPAEITKELKKITNEDHQFSVNAVCEYFWDFDADEIRDLREKIESGEVFNREQTIKYIMYLDANNLYWWAMSQPLPVNGFKWIPACELPRWEIITDEDGIGCILEVDLEYPEDLHDNHNEYPLAPESLKINKVNKLIPNLQCKTKYILHYKHVLEQSEIFYLVKFLHYFIIFSNIGNTIAKLFSLKIKWKF